MTSAQSRSTLSRIVRIAKAVYFGSLTSLPVIACLYRNDLRMVLACFAICLFTGVVLESAPIVLMILGAGLGPQLRSPIGNGRDIAPNEWAAFLGAIFGLMIGVVVASMKDSSKPADSENTQNPTSEACDRSTPDV